MNILHLASFTGNLGDNANHYGFRHQFKKIFGNDVNFTDLEIREFYWKERKFDHSFVKMANSADLVVLGGGNYFELWVPGSKSGTSIDISIEDLKKIKTPLLFNALGCDAGQGIPQENIQNFNSFVETVFANPQNSISLRNDGATQTFNSVTDNKYKDKISSVPDGAFLMPTDEIGPWNHSKPYIAINIAGDMLETRFSGSEPHSYSYPLFLDEFANFLTSFLADNENFDVYLVPHIFRDLSVYVELFDRLSDRVRRTRIHIAPYSVGHDHAKNILSLYKTATASLGMRFHANVCPITLGCPTIGLYCYPQVKHLYDEMGFSQDYVAVNQSGFAKSLRSKLDQVLTDPAPYKNKYKELVSALQKSSDEFLVSTQNLLK